MNPSPTTFFVSPAGNDANTGAQEAPFQTLPRARDAIRSLKSHSGLPADGIHVYLMDGEHVLTDTFVLTPEDSGAAGRPIRYEAAPAPGRSSAERGRSAVGAGPVISGARTIGGWRRLVERDPSLTDAARGKLFVADVPKGWRFHYFFVNGQRQQVARWPNHDRWREWPVYRVYDDEGIWLPADAPIRHLPDNGDTEMVQLPAEWWNTLVTVRKLDRTCGVTDFGTNNSVRLAKRIPDWMPHQFSFRNALCLLDEPGDWCVDSAAGKVYYWPPDGTMAGKTTAAPALCRLVQLEADAESGAVVAHIEFHGLTFRNTDRLAEDEWPGDWLKRNSESPDAALHFTGVADCAVTNCTICDVGAGGITLAYRAKRVRLVGNEIARTGSCGIYSYGWGSGALDSNRDNVIGRNYIHEVGTAPYWHAAAISLVAASRHTITHNFLENLPYAAISIGENMAKELPSDIGERAYPAPREASNAYKQFRYAELPVRREWDPHNIKDVLHSGDSRIERNIVHHYMVKLNDGAALYCWGCGENNLWRENIIARTTDTEKSNGIYMDDETHFALIEGNRVWGPIPRAWFDNSHDPLGRPIAEVCENTDPLPVASGGCSNIYRNNLASPVGKPAGYDELLEEIVQDVQQHGGWPGNPIPPTGG
ncbi:MAG: right-handed parallel beta-helix repeat-containing protein [Lentisphaerae bacterium]|nr:right-handed parallel beta-helix repeat-containing protein [Lentisphaerota bacterium]